jgi:O-antigen/teichoic acid export membrane protein
MRSLWQAGVKRVRHRFQLDQSSAELEILRRMAKNALHLLGGNGASVMLGIITLGITAHYLGPAALGVLALIEAYGTLCDQVLRLETWQGIVKYGATALKDREGGNFVILVKLSTAIDLTCAAITGTVALLAIPAAAAVMGWSQQTIDMAQVYTIAIYFAVSSTPMGVLRLFDRFAQFAWLDPAMAVLRLAGALAIVATQGSIWAFLLLNIAIQVIQRLSLTFMAWRILNRNGYGSFWRARLRDAPSHFPGFWGFTFAANASVLLRKGTQQLDILVVGGFAGATAAGIYQIVRKLTVAINTAGGMLQQVAFPDLARLWAGREIDQFYNVVRKVEGITLAFGAAAMLALVLAGERVIAIMAGPAFAQAYVPLLIQALASMLFLAGSTLRPALMCMECHLQLLRIMTAAAIVFCVVLFSTVSALGIIGAACAHIAFAATVFVAAKALFRQRLLAEGHRFRSHPG